MTPEEKTAAIIIDALVEALEAKNEQISKAKVLETYCDETHSVLSKKQAQIDYLRQKVDDLSEALAVTQSQLEEARAKLAQYTKPKEDN